MIGQRKPNVVTPHDTRWRIVPSSLRTGLDVVTYERPGMLASPRPGVPVIKDPVDWHAKGIWLGIEGHHGLARVLFQSGEKIVPIAHLVEIEALEGSIDPMQFSVGYLTAADRYEERDVFSFGRYNRFNTPTPYSRGFVKLCRDVKDHIPVRAIGHGPYNEVMRKLAKERPEEHFANPVPLPWRSSVSAVLNAARNIGGLR